MRFRTALILTLVALISVALVTSVVVVTRILEDAARREITSDLQRTTEVVQDLQDYRRTLFASEARVVAEEPRIKAVVVAEETTPETILGVAREMHGVVRSEIFLLTDDKGQLRADVTQRVPAGVDLGSVPAIAAALSRGEGDSFWIHDAKAYHLHAQRIALGDVSYGAVVIGHQLDDRLARTVEKQTGSSVIVSLGQRIVAASSLAELGNVTREELATVVAKIPSDTKTPAGVEIHGTQLLAMSATFPRSQPDQVMRYVLLRSLDQALAPARRLNRILYGLLAAALALAFLAAVVVARRLTRPIDALVTFTRKIASGDLSSRAPVIGTREVQSLSVAMNQMAGDLETSRRELANKERLQQEVEIAANLQMALLPKAVTVPGLEIATHMTPSTEVGGDYFDILPVTGGCWIGVGDVAGHGLKAGVVMLMLHSVVATLVEDRAQDDPKALVITANRLLYAAVRDRLKSDEHITFTLARFHDGGRLVYAGAHEPMFVCHRGDGPCERLLNPGTWLAGMRNVERSTKNTEYHLQEGDLVVMYSDGITEAMDVTGAQFGLDRLCAVVEAHRAEPTAAIVDRIVEAVKSWAPVLNDDVSLVIVRYAESVRGGA